VEFVDAYYSPNRKRKTKQNNPERRSGEQAAKITTQEITSPVLNGETLKEFCQMPKSRAEIAVYFNLEIQSARRLVAAKVKESTLVLADPEIIDARFQRFIGAE